MLYCAICLPTCTQYSYQNLYLLEGCISFNFPFFYIPINIINVNKFLILVF